jgi:glutathione synthase/RimK-type ligase-like ATP-grasp enzyme
MNRIGVVSENWREWRSNEKGLDSFLHKDFDKVGYFSWGDVSSNVAAEAFVNGECVKSVPLSGFDFIYLSSLGAIEGKYDRVVNFIERLEDVDGEVVNSPITMINNFDKGYLLTLQDSGVPVVPTTDARNMDFEDVVNLYGDRKKVVKPRYFGERMEGVLTLGEDERVESQDSWNKYVSEMGGSVLVQPFVDEIYEGERSFTYVGDSFSHGVYRARDGWKENSALVFEAVDLSAPERGICENILEMWPDRKGVTRFDFIGGIRNPRISEVEMVNPNLWIGRGLDGVDENFGNAFLGYLREYKSSNSQ